MRRFKLGWKAGLAVAVVLMAAGVALAWYGEWVADFADRNLRVDFPGDVALAAPRPDVPAEIAAFAGIWGGDRWDGGAVPVGLAVENVTAGGAATIVYAWGADRELHRPHGSIRLRGRVVGGHLMAMLPDRKELDWSIAADGRLFGRLTPLNDWRSYTLLRRIVAPSRAAAISAAARRSGPLWQEISIPEHARIGDAAGRSLTLRATLYRSARPGRQGLVILNPGSNDRLDPGDVEREEKAARVFLAHGYGVVVPMRKGRGGSGGPLIEGRDFAGPPDSVVQIESGIEDLDAVVAYMTTQDFVDPARIALVGRQHGGLLALAYAGRHPDKIADAVNIAGGWWPMDYRDGALDTEVLSAAGRTAGATGQRPPTLWLYAEGDPLWDLAHAERNIAAYRQAGGDARLVVFPDPEMPRIYLTQLFEWTAKWEDAVMGFLAGIALRDVGLVPLTLPDPLGGKAAIEAAVFYPSATRPHQTLVEGQWIAALTHAPLAEGRFPVILISPDFGGDRFSHHDLAGDLARRGFIVVALRHPGEDTATPGGWRSERALKGREYDLRAALDAVLADPALRLYADPARVGVVGLGFGGYAALLLAGGKPDLGRLDDYCKSGLDPSCKGAAPSESQEIPLFSDPRIKAAALLAPHPGFLLTAEGLRDVRIPLRLYRVGADRRKSAPDDAERIRTLLPHAPDYVDLAHLHPTVFLAPCTPSQREVAPENCVDPPGVDRAAFHEQLAAELAEFFTRAWPR